MQQLVVAEDNDMIPIGFGSGFLVEENLIVTNHHVINGANGGYVKFINEDTIYEIEGVLALNELTDLAVLQIQPSGKIDFIKSVTQPPQIGESVFALGNPLGLEGTFSDGIVSAIRNYPDTTLFQIIQTLQKESSARTTVLPNQGSITAFPQRPQHNAQSRQTYLSIFWGSGRPQVATTTPDYSTAAAAVRGATSTPSRGRTALTCRSWCGANGGAWSCSGCGCPCEDGST